jgi:hypothetical protein
VIDEGGSRDIVGNERGIGITAEVKRAGHKRGMAKKEEKVKMRCLRCGKEGRGKEIIFEYEGKEIGTGEWICFGCDRSFWMREGKKRRGREAIAEGIRSGRIERGSRCEKCGREGKTEGHHHKGYERENWLVVEWLCEGCHVGWHREERDRLRVIFSVC